MKNSLWITFKNIVNLKIFHRESRKETIVNLSTNYRDYKNGTVVILEIKQCINLF